MTANKIGHITERIEMGNDSNVRFAYLRDPVNGLRVVTFAWRKKTEVTLEYAFAVNRVVSPRGKPETTKSTREQRFYDPHNRKEARKIVLRRLDSARRSLAVIKEGVAFEKTVIDNFLCKHAETLDDDVKVSTRIDVIRQVLHRIRVKEFYRRLTESANKSEHECKCRRLGISDGSRKD